jgi:NADH dehydrogenase
MTMRILVIGAGFAGMWALAAAGRLDREGIDSGAIEVALVAPQPSLVIRPRLYEDRPATMIAPLGPLFDAAGIRYIEGTVEAIDHGANRVEIAHAGGTRSSLNYDSLVLASGSSLFRPDIPGLRDHAFSVDQIDEAAALEAHCHALARLPRTPARNTAVVAGGGFTGIEIAAELPARLRAILGDDADVRVVIVEQAPEIGPDLGPGPRPVIVEALSRLGVELKLGVKVTAIDRGGVLTSDAERIETSTVIWTAGVRASPLTAQIPGDRDNLGRLRVDRDLRVPATTNVFAAGDTACAATDEEGHYTLMSCQHALVLGRAAGHNAAAILLGRPTVPYSQHRYVTGLDLGPWGAVHTNGWDREVVLTGAESKVRKEYVNRILIYPPKADRAEAFAVANPEQPLVR